MATDDLFATARDNELAQRAPLAERMRPSRLADVVGQDALLGEHGVLRTLIESDRLTSAILWGPAGTGKTTIARLIARSTKKKFETLSAVSASVGDVRKVLARADARLGEYGQGTILFLDEVHRFNRAQQDVLLPAVESGLIVLVGATTENPYFEVNPPLLSRSTLFRLLPLDDAALQKLLERALKLDNVAIDDAARDHLVGLANGDGRHLLTCIEVATALAVDRVRDGNARAVITLDDAQAALGARSVRFGRDDHYDVVSAFIKSIRGSDPDAGLYWLAVMLEAGEDARFIARRMVILASEDIGMADPTSLSVATAAAHALEFVGLPEAQLNLAHAVVHLACAPKSNSVTAALGRAQQTVRSGPAGGVPAHLRDAHYRGAKSLGHGEGYEYPHNDPQGWVDAQYLPDGLSRHQFYQPLPHGVEPALTEALQSRTRKNQ